MGCRIKQISGAVKSCIIFYPSRQVISGSAFGLAGYYLARRIKNDTRLYLTWYLFNSSITFRLSVSSWRKKFCSLISNRAYFFIEKHCNVSICNTMESPAVWFGWISVDFGDKVHGHSQFWLAYGQCPFNNDSYFDALNANIRTTLERKLLAN